METTALNQDFLKGILNSSLNVQFDTPTPKKKLSIQEKREKLKQMSKPLKELLALGQIPNINEGLKQIYAQQGHTELNTIYEWNKKGFRVKAGETALLLWGSKKEGKPKETAENTDPYDFFPICHVFSILQVEERRENR